MARNSTIKLDKFGRQRESLLENETFLRRENVRKTEI